MEYVIGIVVIVLLIGILLYYREQHEKSNTKENVNDEIDLNEVSSTIEKPANDRPFNDQMDILLGEITRNEFDETKLIEVTDQSILSHVSSLVPTIVNESASYLNQPKIPANGLFEVIIPNGVELAKSGDLEGAVRGFYKNANGKIAGQANLVPVELGSKLGNVMGTVSSVMNIASIMVGQYYMSEINSRLQTIENEIKSIGDFQKNEFESNVITKIVDVMELSKFSDEIMRSEEVRQHKLIQIDLLKSDIAQLIEQLLLQIKLEPINKKKIKEYEEKSRDLDKEIKFLISLMMSLQELGNIELILGKGDRPKEMVFSRYNIEEKKVLSLFENIKTWHSDHGIVYEIDLENNRRIKRGMRGALGSVQALHNKDKKYDYLDADFSQILSNHIDLSLEEPVKLTKPEKVRIIYNSENDKSYVSLD
ncbi:hypothetical protein [Vagococcus fluvialis]|uniref:hypothetical protein n=1 Tax=Vagococcus fluvialis TaxID=2738 RepID=UPI001D0B6172|nr:hypothetical protein [Vagococcus fluvialis]UDM79125.1 hypothetical protein K5K97_10455 [Vagococcus fluvialis]